MDPIFDYRPPCPALRGYVRQFQVVGCQFPLSMVELPIKAYWPRAEQSLAFYPKDPESLEYGFDGNRIAKARATLNGQFSVITNRHVGRDFMVFQVQFQPGALCRLMGIPAHELTNSCIDAETLFGAEVRQVNERLSYTRHYTDMIPIVEAFLLALVSRTKQRDLRPIDRVSQYLLQHPAGAPLDWLAGQACLSQRQFYRQFMEREGVSPKLYSRIHRFEQAMKAKNASPNLDWLSIALALGYHDYQHLARDFAEFTHLTPNAFLLRDGHSPERTFGVREI